jgi:hypothetical protein
VRERFRAMLSLAAGGAPTVFLFFQIPGIIDIDTGDIVGSIANRLIAGNAGLPEDRWPLRSMPYYCDPGDHLTNRVEKSTDRTRSVVLLHVRGYVHKIIAGANRRDPQLIHAGKYQAPATDVGQSSALASHGFARTASYPVRRQMR